eukprot:839625_1
MLCVSCVYLYRMFKQEHKLVSECTYQMELMQQRTQYYREAIDCATRCQPPVVSGRQMERSTMMNHATNNSPTKPGDGIDIVHDRSNGNITYAENGGVSI